MVFLFNSVALAFKFHLFSRPLYLLELLLSRVIESVQSEQRTFLFRAVSSNTAK